MTTDDMRRKKVATALTIVIRAMPEPEEKVPTITYPPEMLPSPDEGDEVEIIVVEPRHD